MLVNKAPRVLMVKMVYRVILDKTAYRVFKA
jgi:hypothetical protein